MHSGAEVARQLDSAMLGLGIDTNTVGLASVDGLAAAGSAAMNIAAGLVLDTMRPSPAPQLTYREYYANYWIIANCGKAENILNGAGINIALDKIDWARMPAGNLGYEVNPSTGSCTFTLANIPLKDGSVVSLTGETGKNPAAPIASMTVAVDSNHDGFWDGVNIGLDTNQNGSMDRFISTGNSQESMLDADRELFGLYQYGQIGSGFWESYTDWSTSQLVNNSHTDIPAYVTPDLSPIGAFYESRSAGHDAATSIANRTVRILDGAGGALTAAQLAALDVNADGKLAEVELGGLMAWRDLNEDGVLEPGSSEFISLGVALQNNGMDSIKSADYAFYTRGNAAYRSVAQGIAPAPASMPAAPLADSAAFSSYAVLRQTDNRFNINADEWIDWSPGQVKISSDQRSMVGTDAADTFDIGYYAAYNGIFFNLDLVQDFYAGGGGDLVGGSARNDAIWGGAGDDNLLGYEGNDKLYGEDGNDILEGDTGNDFLHGGAGNDLLFGGDGSDNLAGAEGNDEIQGEAGNDTVHGGAGDDKLFGQAGNDVLAGGDGNDIMLGFTASNDAKQTLGAGETDDDRLYGGNGADELWGGLGNDVIDGGADADLVMGAEGNDILFGGYGDDEANGGTGDDSIDGGAGADKMFGGVGNDRMWGGDGDDIVLGFTPANDARQTLAAGETDNDVIHGGAGKDLILGGLGDDQIGGGIGGDELQGGDGNDALYGEADDDRLFGEAGNDILYGGDGDDILVGFTGTNDMRQTLAPGENDDDFLYGGAGSDLLLGGLGNDYLDGGAGADDMEGGMGNDTYIVNTVNDVILEQQHEGYDSVVSSASTILSANIEALRLVEGHAINGTGNSLGNTLIGNNQNNILDGVTGADIMMGGAGNDTYYVDNGADLAIELAGDGTDTVNSSISHTLEDNLENLVLLDFSMAEKGMADGVDILVYGYPKAFELDYMQGNAVAGYQGTCALTAIANLSTQASQALSEAQVVQRAIDNQWAVTDPAVSDYQRGGSNYLGQQALLDSYGIRNGIVMGYNEEAIANLLKGGRGVILGVNAGRLWDDAAYLDHGGVNHVVTVTGVACDAGNGAINGFYIADSGRGRVSDMTRYIPIDDLRAEANVANAYAIYTIEPIKLWEENIDGTGNALNNMVMGNRGNNMLAGGQGMDTLIGGAGDDTYVFFRGDGQDTIVENDDAANDTDILQLADISQSDLWFSHVGGDLQIKVMGTDDQIVVRGWYAGGASDAGRQVDCIRTADGLSLHNADVEKLVQAMAAFAPPAAAQADWTTQQDSYRPMLLAASQ